MSMLGYGSPQQVSQSGINIQQAIQMMGPTVNQMVQYGNITTAEAQAILTALNQPAQMQALQQRIYQTYGEMAIQPQVLQQTISQIILAAAQKIRINQQSVPLPTTGYQTPAYNTPYVGGPAIAQVENTAYNAGAIYGPNGANNRVAQYGACEQTHNASRVPEQPAVPVDIPKRMPTNAPIEIDLTDDYRVLGAPTWTPAPAAEKVPFHTILEVVGDIFSINCGNRTVETATVRLETPMASMEGAIADVGVNHPELMDPEKKFADVLVFKQIVIGRMSFNVAKDLYLKCRDAMQDGDTTGVLNVMKILGERNDDAGRFLSSLTLQQFNNAAGVNFMKTNASATGMHRLRPFESMSQLSRLIVDSGDYEDWITDRDSFAQALKNCLRVSFNRVFSRDVPGFLDISADDEGNPRDNRARMLMLNDERLGLRFKSGEKEEVSRLIPFLSPSSKEDTVALRDGITAKLKNIFPFILERKVLVHNLPLPAIAPGRTAAEWLHHTPEALILADFFARHGSMETVNVNDLEQLRHPLMLGMGYEGQLLVRRI